MEPAMPPETLDLSIPEFLALRSAGTSVALVDCREPWEWELVRLPGAALVPLGALAGRAAEVPRDRLVVVYCHHGIRSRRGAALLRAAGVEGARSLEGGIDLFSLAVDPSLPRY